MKRRNIFWGIFFIIATVLLIASQLTSFETVGFWSLLATIVLIAIIIQSIFYRVFFGILLPVSLLYMIYQAPFGFPYISPWILVVAAILLSIGLHMIFKSRPKKAFQNYGHPGANSEISSNDDDNNPVISVKFGNTVRYLHSTCLKSGQFKSSFGALEVYFDKAVLSPEGAEIFLECSFGAIKLYIPRNWNIVDRTNRSGGGVAFKNGSPSFIEGAPTLTLTGNISMAGVEVLYI